MKCRHATLLLRLISSFVLLTSSAFATTPVVTVKSPANGSSDLSPVNYVASASSSCSKGIAAMRIYPSPGFNAFTINANNLNANINLPAGTYNTVVQAWDNCGGVGKTTVKITVTGNRLPPPKFFYPSDYNGNKVNGYLVNETSGAISPTSQGAVTVSGGPSRIASDKGGFRLYVAESNNRSSGSLNPVPGSPFSLGGGTPTSVAVAPSGKFVYVTTFNNNVVGFAVQSDGSLKPIPGSPFSTQVGPTWVVVDPSSSFVYVTDWQSDKLDAFSINKTNGALTPVPGSPYVPPNSNCSSCTLGGSAWGILTDRSGNYLIVPGYTDGGINVYKIDHTTGALSLVPGSPFVDRQVYGAGDIGPNTYIGTIDAENHFYFNYDSADDDIAIFTFNQSTGKLTLVSHELQLNNGMCAGDQIQADPSGSFVYGTPGDVIQCGTPSTGALFGFSVNQANGTLTNVPGSPFTFVHEGGVNVDGIAVTP
jgi:6-phosphogluconolactonase (cycloisomerase 2 family)